MAAVVKVNPFCRMGNRGMYNAQPPQHAPPKPGPPSSISSNSAAYATPIYNKESSQPPISVYVDDHFLGLNSRRSQRKNQNQTNLRFKNHTMLTKATSTRPSKQCKSLI